MTVSWLRALLVYSNTVNIHGGRCDYLGFACHEAKPSPSKEWYGIVRYRRCLTWMKEAEWFWVQHCSVGTSLLPRIIGWQSVDKRSVLYKVDTNTLNDKWTKKKREEQTLSALWRGIGVLRCNESNWSAEGYFQAKVIGHILLGLTLPQTTFII